MMCRGKDYVRFCELRIHAREHPIEIINFKKEKLKLLTKVQQESYENAKICYILKKNLKMNMLKIKNIVKRDYCH